MRGIRTVLALALGAAFAGCGEVRDPPRQSFATGTVCPSGGTTLRYSDFDLDFFGDAAGTTGYCNYCHHSSRTTPQERNGAPPNATLDDLAVVRAYAPVIDAYAGKGPVPTGPPYFMPYVLVPPLPPGVPDPQPMPTDAERERLSEWLACGAPL